jgi:hypothetical protein
MVVVVLSRRAAFGPLWAKGWKTSRAVLSDAHQPRHKAAGACIDDTLDAARTILDAPLGKGV